MARTDGPYQGDTAVLLHSIEYALARGEIWQYRRLRGQYHREHYVSFAQWCHFLEVEERLAQSPHINEPFRSGYLKCLSLQAARDTGFINFWLIFWRLACADGSAREASQLMLNEAIPDTFDAVRLLSHMLNSPEFASANEKWDGMDDRWKFLAKAYAPLNPESLCNVSTNFSRAPQLGACLADMIRSSPARTEGLQELMRDIESAREPRQEHTEALLAWGKAEHSEHVYFSILRRLQRHPYLEGSPRLACALISTLSNIRTTMDPNIIEAVTLRTCQLAGCDVTTRLMCLNLLCEVGLELSSDEMEKTGRTHYWLQCTAQTLLSPALLRQSTEWDDIVTLHLYTYSMLAPHCDDKQLEQVYSFLVQNMVECHGSPLPRVPYSMMLARAGARYRRWGAREGKFALFEELINEFVDPETGTFGAAIVGEVPHMVQALLEIPRDECTLKLLYNDLIRILERRTTAEQYPREAPAIVDILLQALTRQTQLSLPDPARQWEPFRRLLLLRSRFWPAVEQRRECARSYGNFPKRTRFVIDAHGGGEDGSDSCGNGREWINEVDQMDASMEQASIDEDRPELKVFLSNLPFQATESSLLTFLRTHAPDCVGIKLIRDSQGHSKGVGHATFKSAHAAQEVLLLDRILFEGRPLFISPYQPVPRSQRHRIASAERNAGTLFLSHLPVGVTRDELLSLLELDPSTSVRLVPNKHIAYVECPNEEIASHCVRSHDNGLLRGTSIHVQISDPQAARARATAMSMLPRGVRSRRGARLSK